MARSSTAAAGPAFPGVRFTICGLAIVVAAGAAVTLPPPTPFILIAVVAMVLVGAVVLARVGTTPLAVEVPLLLLLLSTLVWRIRESTALAESPLDGAGAARTGMVLLAGFLGLVALLVPRGQAESPFPPTWRLYVGYVLVVFVGALLSVYPLLTAYRGVELTVGLVVLAGARRTTPDAGRRVEAVLYWFSVGLLVSVWAGVVFAPSRAVGYITNAPAPIPWQIQGVYPALSANSVGALGVLLVFWSITRWPKQRPKQLPMALLGLVTLVAAQYRTGYVALVVGLIVLLVVTRRWPLLVLLGVVLVALVAYKPQLVTGIAPYALRGDSLETARGLNSRINWWEASLPLWRESPLVGRGLLTGTRFEVLANLGRSETSSIHGTWIEALAGTGTVGCALLALAYLTAVGRAMRTRSRTAVLLLAVLAVHTVTGSTFEAFGLASLLLLWAAMDPSGQHALGDGAVDREEAEGAAVDGAEHLDLAHH